MNFENSVEVTILVDQWRTTTLGEYLLSLLAVLLIAFANQYLVHLTRRFHGLRRMEPPSKDPTAPFYADRSTEYDSLLTRSLEEHLLSEQEREVRRQQAELVKPLPPAHKHLYFALEMLFFFLGLSVGYLMMLAAMTENVGLFLAVVLGESLGLVLFTQVWAPEQQHTASGRSSDPVQ